MIKAGTADFAHNLQVEASALEELATNEQGEIVTLFGSKVERIMLNFAHPFARTGGWRTGQPHHSPPLLQRFAGKAGD